MKNNIFYGGSAIILPYKKHRRYTDVQNKNSICKITPYNKGEMVLLPQLLKKPDSSEYLIEIIKSCNEDLSLLDNRESKNRDFMKYLDSLNHEEKPKFYYKNSVFSYVVFRNAEIDLYEIQKKMFDFRSNYFTRDTELKTNNLCRDLIEGLRFLHKNHICHFDIKPENIVLDNGRFKYIDFGLAEDFPFTTYIKLGPRGTIEYIPFSTNNFRILNIFTEFLPYMPCDDWYRKEDGIWRHIHYDNNPSKNTSPISSSIYKADVYSLGRTINSLLKVICLYKDCTLIDKQFLNKMLEPKVFLRSSILDENVMVPPKILNIPDEELDINCCLLWRANTSSLGRPSKLISFKFT